MVVLSVSHVGMWYGCGVCQSCRYVCGMVVLSVSHVGTWYGCAVCQSCRYVVWLCCLSLLLTWQMLANSSELCGRVCK